MKSFEETPGNQEDLLNKLVKLQETPEKGGEPETSSIIFATNKEIVDWAERLGDPVLTTAMLDRILYHAKCYSFRGESYQLKHPDL